MSDSPEEISAKVSRMITDPQRARRSDPGNPDVCNVFDFHNLYTDPETVKEIDEQCRTAGIGCVECKQKMAEGLIAALEPIREKRTYYEARPELVDEMVDTSAEFSMEGESREMTVLFSDVRGFTTISEGLDPKQLTQLMNALLTPMTKVIHKNRGTIDQYMGDAIMAFWGAPLDDPEHARHALYAAFDMMKELGVSQHNMASRCQRAR